jgi:hypothetical protein
MTEEIKITDFVSKANVVNFDSFRNGIFYYNVANIRSADTYQFQIPIEETNGATFLAKDKSTMYMRWIRKSIENNTMIKI